MGLAHVISDPDGDRERGSLRQGTVVSYDAGSITVRVGDGQQDRFPYLRSYQPILGEPVVLQQYGSTWLCIGTPAGMPPEAGVTGGVDFNPVVNPSFEADPDTTSPPTGWGVHQAGVFSPTVQVNQMGNSLVLDGRKVCQVSNTSSANSGITNIYSSAIPVQAGQMWSASAWFSSVVLPAAEEAQIELRLAWFADAPDVYPNTVAADNVIGVLETPLGTLPIWVPLRDGYAATGTPVPSGAAAMRVVIQVVTRGATTFVFLDRVVARRVS